MNYRSTRNNENIVTPSQAILEGLAIDGGLYVPESFPSLEFDWEMMKEWTYQEMAQYILEIFLSDFSKEDLQECIRLAYDDKFDHPQIAPLIKVDDHYHLELFHGATIAFKDMALSILPHLLKTAAKMNGNTNEIVILTATSGDTGKAAMAGFQDVPGTKIIVFYPEGGVSPIQERQMTTQKGENVYVVAVKDNFDAAQSQVKELFNDPELRQELAYQKRQFSSANSMNIGRLIPQIVYYFFAYSQLLKTKVLTDGDSFNVSVPTGNFGNILAAYYAKRIGLPIDKLICASNDNKALYDFFETGTYNKNRDFVITSSPSMDILISSNFERLLYEAVGQNNQVIKNLMLSLQTEGEYSLSGDIMDFFKDFIGETASEADVSEEIRIIHNRDNYIMDPHTAVASRAWRKAYTAEEVSDNVVIISTASPYKFPEAVLNALDYDTEDLDIEELIDLLQKVSDIPLPDTIKDLEEAEIRHNRVIETNEMRDLVYEIAVQSE